MLVHPNFDPVAFRIGPLAVRWYGLMYLVGFLIFSWLGRLRARQTCTSAREASSVIQILPPAAGEVRRWEHSM